MLSRRYREGLLKDLNCNGNLHKMWISLLSRVSGRCLKNMGMPPVCIGSHRAPPSHWWSSVHPQDAVPWRFVCAVEILCLFTWWGSLSRGVVDWQEHSRVSTLKVASLISKMKEPRPARTHGASVSQPCTPRACFSSVCTWPSHTAAFNDLNTSTQISLHRFLNLKGFIFQEIKHVN